MTDILVIGARGIPNMEGGAEKNAEMLFPQLVDAGYSVELLGIKEYITSPEFKGVKLRGLPTINIMKTDKIVYNLLALLYAVFTRPKIVHLQCLNSALFLLFYKMAGLKVVMRYGSSDYEFDKWGFVQRLVLRICEYQVRYADHVVTVSQKFRKSLKERHGLQNITVIPNGLDRVNVSAAATKYYNDLGLAQTPYVLSVGRVTADKDFETLVEAVRGLDDPSIQLVVAGGVEEGFGKKFVADTDPRIRFIGRVDRDLLPALYDNAAVYVNSSRHEGLSNAVLEALSYGCPLILSDIPANVEMGVPDENYFSVGDADKLRVKIKNAIENPDAYRCVTDNFAKWEDVYRDILRVYAHVAPKTFCPAAVIKDNTASQSGADTPGSKRLGTGEPSSDALGNEARHV